MNFVALPYCTVYYDHPVVTLKFKENSELDIEETREMIRTVQTLTRGRKYLLLSDVRVHFSITSEGRRIAASREEAPDLVANAVVTNNLPTKLTANFFAKFNKPHFKFKVFTVEQAAMDWLLKHAALLEENLVEKN